MKLPQCVELLRKIPPNQQKKFGEFVASPYFNRDKRLRKLCDHILDHVHDPAYLEREALYKAVFGKTPFHYQSISDLLTYLMRLLERFLAVEAWQADHHETTVWMLRALQTLDPKSFHKVSRKYVTRWPEPQTASAYEHRYQYRQLRFELDQFQGKQEETVGIEAVMTDLDQAYALRKLRLMCGLLQRNPALKLSPSTKSWLDSLHTPEVHYAPLVHMYLNIWALLKASDASQILPEIVEYLRTNEENWPPDVQHELYAYVMNACIRLINTGKQEFRPLLFTLYVHQLESGLILQQQLLGYRDYKNITSLALKLEKYDWAKSFIETYQFYLAPQHHSTAYTYNLAHWHYATQSYPMAKQMLQRTTFDDSYYELGAKAMLVKMYLEEGEWDSLGYLLRAFDRYVRRPRNLPAYQRQIYLHFIKFCRQLASLREKLAVSSGLVAHEEVVKLQDQIGETPETAQHQWLTTQITQLAHDYQFLTR